MQHFQILSTARKQVHIIFLNDAILMFIMYFRISSKMNGWLKKADLFIIVYCISWYLLSLSNHEVCFSLK